jgi:hypothetical protein
MSKEQRFEKVVESESIFNIVLGIFCILLGLRNIFTLTALIEVGNELISELEALCFVITIAITVLLGLFLIYFYFSERKVYWRKI